MDITIITQLVSSLGFPIVACIYMAYLNHKQNQQHADEMKEMTKAVNQLENAVIKLCERIDGNENK